MINQLKSIPLIGISAFVDESNKSIFLMFSNSLFTLFCTHIYKLKLNIHDNKSLQEAFNRGSIEVLNLKEYKEDPGTVVLRSDYQRILDDYVSNGYTDMRAGYKAINYRLKTYVLTDYRVPSTHAPLVYVVARSPNSGEMLLGVFTSIPEADEWIQSVYGDKRSDIIPVYCENELTRDYISKNGYEIHRGKGK